MAKLALLYLAVLLIVSQQILAQFPDFSSVMGGSNPLGSMGDMMGGMGGNGFGGNNGGFGNGGAYPNENFDNHYNGCPAHNQCQCNRQRKIECNQNSCPRNQVCCRVDCCTKRCERIRNGK